jgi:hypothetical protein
MGEEDDHSPQPVPRLIIHKAKTLALPHIFMSGYLIKHSDENCDQPENSQSIQRIGGRITSVSC